MNEAAALTAELGRQLGVEGLTLDERGSASLEIDEVVLNLEADDDGRTLVLHAVVGSTPRRGETPTELYETLLRANFYHLGTGGATLGMDREAGFIALVQRVPLFGVDAVALAATVEQFVNFAEGWTRRIEQLFAAGGQAPLDAGADPDGLLRI